MSTQYCHWHNAPLVFIGPKLCRECVRTNTRISRVWADRLGIPFPGDATTDTEDDVPDPCKVIQTAEANAREQERQYGYAQAERDIVAYFGKQAAGAAPESLEWRVLYGVFSLVAEAVTRGKHRKGVE